MLARLRSRLTYANVMATVAVFIALGGTGAYATHELIYSDDIVDGQVKQADLAGGAVTRTKLGNDSVNSPKVVDNNLQGVDIRDGSVTGADLAPATVTPSNLKLIGHDAVAAEGSTSSQSYTDLATPGPSVTVNLAHDGLVAVFARADIEALPPDPPNPNEGGSGSIGLFESSYLSPPEHILGAICFPECSSPAYQTVQTGGSKIGSWLVFPLSAGSHTFIFKYRTDNSGGASFKNRELWVLALAASS